MFDSSFLELLIIGFIALIVIGPERLPEVASKVGKMMGKARAFVANTREDIEKEIRAEELRGMLSKQKEEINELRDMVKNSGKDIADEVADASDELKDVVGEVKEASELLAEDLKEAEVSLSKKPSTK